MNAKPSTKRRVSAERAGLTIGASCGLLGLLGVMACAPEPAQGRANLPAAPAPLEMPGPAPRGRDPSTASALNDGCTGCHSEIAAEWRASFHARAQRDPAYQRAFAIEPLSFCQGCHAPEADARRPVPEAAADLGVGCVTCHVVGEKLLASASGTSVAPHAVTRSPEFAGTGACASCHQFAFPELAPRGQLALMQATLREHEQSSESGKPCADCHMPRVGTGLSQHRSHAFQGGHDAEFVKGALRVRAERRTATRFVLVLQSQGVGHAFPTGDLFRRLELSAEAVGSDYQVVGSARRYLSRHWTDKPRLARVVRDVQRDDRPGPTPLAVELELELAGVEPGAVAAVPIAFRVAYQRVEHPRSEAEADSVMEGEIEIASGTLPPLSKGDSADVHP